MRRANDEPLLKGLELLVAFLSDGLEVENGVELIWVSIPMLSRRPGRPMGCFLGPPPNIPNTEVRRFLSDSARATCACTSTTLAIDAAPHGDDTSVSVLAVPEISAPSPSSPTMVTA